MQSFTFTRTPHFVFGPEKITSLAAALASRGFERIVVVFSLSVLSDDETREGLERMYADAGIRADHVRYDRLPDGSDPFTASRGEYSEASPDVVDAIARRVASAGPDAVVAIGGGSAIDTGKALSVALAERAEVASITELLEGVGTRAPSGRKLPFIAVPTTAGTGSEATKNAVLSRVGQDGFKKSLRHDNFVPDLALIDPLLQLSCPREHTAASGLDAITQLIEAYVSTGASPLSDALAYDGLVAAGRSFVRAVERGDTDVDARAGMSYAAFLSGVCLANAGLGTVHGLAGPAGALTNVPHGVFCGTLLPVVVDRTVDALSRRSDATAALGKFAGAGRALTGMTSGSLEEQVNALVARLTEYARVAGLPSLGSYGIDSATAKRIAAQGGNKTNPHAFTTDELAELIMRSS
jgi:alcohol dehydrogenase class IV